MWQPIQYHFHSPSEHTLEGRSFDAEMHIVHVPMNGEGPDGVTYDTADANPTALAVFGLWFTELDCESMLSDDMDAKDECFVKRGPSDDFFNQMLVFDDEELSFKEDL